MHMKWGVFLVVLLVIPSVFAIANIEGPGKDSYNLGEKIDISGYILETSDMWGLMSLNLDCGEETPLLARTVSIKANEKYEFSEELPIPFSITGNCKVVLNFKSGNDLIERVESDNFLITKDLVGSFEADNNMVQLGGKVIINGKISKQDGTLVDGLATLFFKKNGSNVLVDSVNVNKGLFVYEFDTKSKPSGTYDLVVFVSDIFGNEKTFSDALQINLINEIYVIAKPNKESLLPGDVISIFGEAKTILQKPVSSADAIFILDGVRYEGKVNSGDFNQRIKLLDKIKSGEHNVHVIIEDEFGNIGETDTKFVVQAIPSSLELEILGGPFKPQEEVVVIPKLFDQANESIEEPINAVLYSSSGEEIESKNINSGEKIKFNLPSFATPGDWYFIVKASGLEIKESILIGEISSVDFFIENSSLIIQNTGNIKYNGVSNIVINGEKGDSKVIKKLHLKPGVRVKVDLGREVIESGIYNVKVGGKEFNNIYIESTRGLFNYDIIYYLAIILFVGFLVWLFLFKSKPKIKKKVKIKNEEKEIKLKLKDKKDDFAEDFKNMALKNIEKTEEKIKKGLKFNFSKKKKSKGQGFVKLGDKSLYKKEKKPENFDAGSIIWGKKEPIKEEKKISKKERKKFKEEAKKDEPKGGMFSMFG